MQGKKTLTGRSFKVKAGMVLLMLLLFLSLTSTLGANSGFAQEIHKTIECGWGVIPDYYSPLRFWIQLTFDPLPEVNKSTTVHVKIKSRFTWPERPRISIYGVEHSELEPEWAGPMEEGEVYEGSYTITPKYKTPSARLETGTGIAVGGPGGDCQINMVFDKSGKLIHLAPGWVPIPRELPYHPAINDTAIHVNYEGEYFNNTFRLVPPPALNETTVVYYKIVAKGDFPRGVTVKDTTRHRWVGDANAEGEVKGVKPGDIYEGSFIIVPEKTGENMFRLTATGLSTQESPPQFQEFRAYYYLDPNGELTVIATNYRDFEILWPKHRWKKRE